MNYSPEIIKAHDTWKKAEDNVPENDYDPKYKGRNATARRMWAKFNNVCNAQGLKAVEVANSLRPKFILTIRK